MKEYPSLYDRLKTEYKEMLHAEVEKYPTWGNRVISQLKESYWLIDTKWGIVDDLQTLTKTSRYNPYILFNDEA